MFDKVLNTTLSKDFSLHKKMKFSIKDFFSKYDQIRRKLDLVTFTEEILDGKLHILCAVFGQ